MPLSNNFRNCLTLINFRKHYSSVGTASSVCNVANRIKPIRITVCAAFDLRLLHSINPNLNSITSTIGSCLSKGG